MSYDSFPVKLRQLPQWVVWKYEPVEGRKKPTKVLYCPNGGYKASSTDPKTWGTFEECVNAQNDSNTYNGIGYVFTRGVVGIDLDNCIETNGSIKPWAQEILDKFDSYTEFSPSKKGLHLIIEADIDFTGHKKHVNKEKEEAIECYMRARYFTVTGDSLEGKEELRHVDEKKIFEWYQNTFESREILVQNVPGSQKILPTDQEIIEFMRRARNGPKFIALYDQGDWKSQGFPSQSEADMSLVGSLMFFCLNDSNIVDRLFRASRLYRKKWDRPDYQRDLFAKCYRPQTMDWLRKETCDEPVDELVIRSLSSVKPTNVRWLWHSRLAKGKITLFQGEPGQGKSQITIYIASCISKGSDFIDDNSCEQGQVLFITAEDDAADTLKPRLMAWDANMDNVFELQWVKTAQGKVKLFNFDKYMDDLKRVCAELPDLKLIVVDPISAFLGKVDGNASGEVRGLLHELKNIAEERNCSVILVTHNNKTQGQKAISRASGSHAFGAAARMVYAFGLRPLEPSEDDETPKDQEFAMAPIKNNLTKDPDTLVYQIISVMVPGEEGEDISTSRIEWHGTSVATAQDILDYQGKTKKRKDGRPPVLRDQCQKDVERLTGLKEKISGDEVMVIKKELISLGYNEQMIKKARNLLGYEGYIIGSDSGWVRKPTPNDF